MRTAKIGPDLRLVIEQHKNSGDITQHFRQINLKFL